jgi:hypothetical protein
LDGGFCTPDTNQVETVASLPTRSRPETGPKPWPEELGIKRRAAVMAVSEIGRRARTYIFSVSAQQFY